MQPVWQGLIVSEWPETAIRELLSCNEEDLLVTLASAVTDAAGGLDHGRLRQIGQAWWDAHLPEIRAAICRDDVLVALGNQQARDAVTLVGALADILSTAIGFPPAMTAAVLAARMGLDQLCSGG
jgi:hypothetical protein